MIWLPLQFWYWLPHPGAILSVAPINVLQVSSSKLVVHAPRLTAPVQFVITDSRWNRVAISNVLVDSAVLIIDEDYYRPSRMRCQSVLVISILSMVAYGCCYGRADRCRWWQLNSIQRDGCWQHWSEDYRCRSNRLPQRQLRATWLLDDLISKSTASKQQLYAWMKCVCAWRWNSFYQIMRW